MADYNKLRHNFINTILERVNTENSLKEWIEPPKNSLFPPYSSEMEELAEVCNNVCFNAKQLSTKLEDYVNDLAEGHNFYGEKQLKEYYTELENLFKKFLEYKTQLSEIILMGNSDDNNESGMNESEGIDINNMSEEEQIETVKKDPWKIDHIKNPSEYVLMTAIKEDPYVLSHLNRVLKNMSPELQQELQAIAVKQNGFVISCIENPSEEIQLMAVQQKPGAIRYIKNPSEEVQLTSVRREPMVIGMMPYASEEVQIIAVEEFPAVIHWIKNPSEAVQLAAVKKDWRSIQFIDDPTSAVQAEVAKHKE